MNLVEGVDITTIPKVKALVDALLIYFYKAKRGPTFPAQPDTALYTCGFTKAEMEQMDAALAPFIESEEATVPQRPARKPVITTATVEGRSP